VYRHEAKPASPTTSAATHIQEDRLITL
jgi:hypothetical protein